MRILILADHQWRDTAGLCSVQVAIESISNHEVAICDIHLFSQVAELFKPHLLVINHLHDPARNKIVDTIRRRGGLCVVLPTEGKPNTDEQVEWAAKKFDTRLCDLYLSWSDEFRKHLEVPAVTVGCPRFDFYSNMPHRGEIASLYGLTLDRPIITVASSFPQAKFAGLASDFLVEDWKKLGVSNIPGREDPSAIANADRRALGKFMVWLETLLVERPEYQMIVKPHPAEDVHPWRVFCARTGAKLMLTDYIFNLLALSDVHVARVGCLTAVEAWLAGKESIQCEVGNDFISGATEESLKLGYRVDQYGSDWGFSAAVFDVLSGDEPWRTARSKPQDEYIEKWLGPRGSAKLIAQALMELLEAKKPEPSFEYTTANRAELHRVLVEHGRQHAVPKADHVGQFGKTVTYQSVQGWLEILRRENGKAN